MMRGINTIHTKSYIIQEAGVCGNICTILNGWKRRRVYSTGGGCKHEKEDTKMEG